MSTVIAALNDEVTLPRVLARLPRGVHQVILVDGGSVDATVSVGRQLRPDALVIRQGATGRRGALAEGFAACTGQIIVMMPADGSADPAEIPHFVAALVAGADVARGSRYRDGGRSAHPAGLARLIDGALSRTANALFGTRFTDVGHGYGAFWRRSLPRLDLPSPTGRRATDRATPDHPATANHPATRGGRGTPGGEGADLRALINIRVATSGLRVAEVATVELLRLHDTGTLGILRDAMRVLRTMVAEFRRRVDRRRSRPAGHRALASQAAEPQPHGAVRFTPAPASGLEAVQALPSRRGAAIPQQRPRPQPGGPGAHRHVVSAGRVRRKRGGR